MLAPLLLLSSSLAAAKPNILFVLGDDLGYGDVSVYPNPTKRGRLDTPRLEQLASEGMTFTDAYAGYSVCAPSRTTLMTGRHSGHFTPTQGGQLLFKGNTTVATVLKRAGYATALFGKWGLDGNNGQMHVPGEGSPTVQGFDWFYGQFDQSLCHNYYPSYLWNNTLSVDIPKNQNASVDNCGADHDKCDWSADLWLQDAVDYILNSDGSRRPADKPFYAFVSFTSPHAGSVGSKIENGVPGPRLSQSRYAKEESWPQVEKDFANTVTLVDHAVGVLVDTVDSVGLKDSTVVFFSSDNGAHNEGTHKYLFFNSSGNLFGFKRSIHDGGHRAAMIVRWPGTTPAGTTSPQIWAFYDFLPTAADIGGVASGDLPSNLDGYSVLPTILGKSQAQPKFIYHDYESCNDPGLSKIYATAFGQNLRMGNWSGVCVGATKPCTATGGVQWEWYNEADEEWVAFRVDDAAKLELGGSRVLIDSYDIEGDWEIKDGAIEKEGRRVGVRQVTKPGHFFLYDMSKDEGQQNDISAQHPDKVKEMLSIMAEQYHPK
eukprot:Hpha_TRINITY_DN16844_c1_g2::TRINITY_DN16844_c1_g2_i1::g.152641::m.152641